MDLSQIMGQLGPMKEAMDKANSEKGSVSFEGKAGGGAVSVTLSGELSLTSVKIAPSAIGASEDDVSMLEDLVMVATNDAIKQYKDKYGATPEEQIQKSMGGGDMASMLSSFM